MSNPTPHLTQQPPLDSRTPDQLRHDAARAAAYTLRRLRQLAATLAWLGLALLLAAALAGCHPQRSVTVPLPAVHTDSTRLATRDSIVIHHLTVRRDSIILRDSIVLTLAPDGTPLRTEAYHTRDRLRIDTLATLRLALHRDTLAALRRDTITLLAPAPTADPTALLTPWQRAKLRYGGYALTALALLFLLAALRAAVGIRNSARSLTDLL